MGTMLALGHPLPGWSKPTAEGAQFWIDYGGSPFLMLLWPNPTPAEVINFGRRKPIRFGLLPVSDHTLFLLFKIEGVTDDWSEAPFALGLTAPDERDMGNRQPDEGYLFSFVLGDNRSGVIYAMRQATVTPRFSQHLDDQIARQTAALSRFDKAAHLREVDLTRQKYPKPADMIADAVIVESLGLPFQKFGEHR